VFTFCKGIVKETVQVTLYIVELGAEGPGASETSAYISTRSDGVINQKTKNKS
jgi:predicted secreted protein